jgi:hypothetical protein
LNKLSSSQAIVPPGIFMQELHESSITKTIAKASKTTESSQETMPPVESISKSCKVMEIHSDRRTPFITYLMIGGLPEDKDEHEQRHRRAGHYTLVNNELFRRSVNDTMMQCILPDEGCAILQDIYSGVCDSHTCARTLMGKTYW